MILLILFIFHNYEYFKLDWVFYKKKKIDKNKTHYYILLYTIAIRFFQFRNMLCEFLNLAIELFFYFVIVVPTLFDWTVLPILIHEFPHFSYINVLFTVLRIYTWYSCQLNQIEQKIYLKRKVSLWQIYFDVISHLKCI